MDTSSVLHGNRLAARKQMLREYDQQENEIKNIYKQQIQNVDFEALERNAEKYEQVFEMAENMAKEVRGKYHEKRLFWLAMFTMFVYLKMACIISS